MTRPLAALAVLAGVLLGMWVTGGLITDDYVGSAVLTGLFFAVSGLGVLLLARRRRDLRWWVLGAYVAAAGGVGGYVLYTSSRSVTVDERLASGDAVVAGSFASGEHTTRGKASIVKLPDGRRVLTLRGFETSPGPDLRVRLVPGRGTEGGAEGNVDLGGLKGNRGDQQYDLPADTPSGPVSVVIWCRAFSAEFGTAFLS